DTAPGAASTASAERAVPRRTSPPDSVRLRRHGQYDHELAAAQFSAGLDARTWSDRPAVSVLHADSTEPASARCCPAMRPEGRGSPSQRRASPSRAPAHVPRRAPAGRGCGKAPPQGWRNEENASARDALVTGHARGALTGERPA